jgi:hypothetical protein
MTPERSGYRILIVATDPILAALVGTLVEHARFSAAFPGPDEAPTQALERVKPLAAVLVDLAEGEGASDLFASRAAKLGVPLFVFGRREIIDAHGEWIQARRVRAFALPDQIAEMESAIEGLKPDAVRPRAPRDRRGETGRRPDGTLDFTDAQGVHWTVYDRRGPERRNRVDRRFVSDAGEVRHCEITEQEARLVSAATLAEQLSRAIAD